MAHVPVEESDTELIRQTAAGDHDAFSALVSRHGAAVFRFARLIAANPSAAEDALQETFLAAWRASGSFREDTSVRNWLLSIARHAVYRQHRRRVGEPQETESLTDLGAAAGWGAVDDDPEASALRQESHEVLARAMNGLRAFDREVLLLRDVEGLSGEEVAALLDLTLPAMKTRLHRARLRLASKVREAYEHSR